MLSDNELRSAAEKVARMACFSPRPGDEPQLPWVDDLVIQRILRHSNVAVTQACYIKTVSEDAKAAMQKLETALNDTYVTPRPPSPGTKGIM